MDVLDGALLRCLLQGAM